MRLTIHFLATRRRLFFNAVLALAAFAPGSVVRADSFGSGANQFTIDFVTIGSPGNPADIISNPNLTGSVSYVYRIGKYEVSRVMIEKASSEGSLGLTLSDMTPYGGNGPDRPATGVTWFEAARFVNWLNVSRGSSSAYKFDAAGAFQLWSPSDAGYDANNLFRNKLAKYFLPSADEWYKAAYYDPSAGVYWDYPTGSNSPPIPTSSGTTPGTAVVNQGLLGPADITQAGGLSPFGTMAQGGNVNEKFESALDFVNDTRDEFRAGGGGNWDAFPSGLQAELIGLGGTPPSGEGPGGGFRVASVIPEPQSEILLAIAILLTSYLGRRCD
jgi:hypothetical protein